MQESTHTESGRLADQLERSFRGGAWHGPATREAIAGVDPRIAGAAPHPSCNTIYQIVNHMAFWIDAARVRIVEARDVDPDEDWSSDATPSPDEWEQAIRRLEDAYAALHAAVLALGDDRLEDPVPGSDPTIRGLLLGTLQHNAYHTGQIVQIARELAS